MSIRYIPHNPAEGKWLVVVAFFALNKPITGVEDAFLVVKESYTIRYLGKPKEVSDDAAASSTAGVVG